MAESQTETTTTTPVRPDFVPEKFWNAEVGEALESAPSLKAVFEGYGALEKRQGDLRNTLKAELEAERVKGRPEKPDAYSLDLKGVLPENLVLLNKRPGDDFEPEAGKQYFVLKADDPLLGFWRQHCFEAGLGQEAFAKGLAAFAQSQAVTQPTEKQIAEAKAAELAKLGEHGPKRAEHVWGRLQAVLGEDKAKALDEVTGSAAAIEALESLLEKAGEPRFAPPGSTAAVAGAEAARSEIARIKADPELSKAFLDRGHPRHKEIFDKMTELHKRAGGAARAA